MNDKLIFWIPYLAGLFIIVFFLYRWALNLFNKMFFDRKTHYNRNGRPVKSKT
jgi:hypothetical protein